MKVNEISEQYDFQIYRNPCNKDGRYKVYLVIYHTKSEDTGVVSDEENAYFNTKEEIAEFLKQPRPEPLSPRIYLFESSLPNLWLG